MPLFPRADPDLQDLIAYVVARARDRDITLTQTKLVKLLYLIDVERVRRGARPLTGLTWRFFHYGPYALELPETLRTLEDRLQTRQWQGAVLYGGARDAPEGNEWPPATRRVVDTIVDRFAPLELNELLDHVYFRTGPMVDARRGDLLDLTRAKGWTEPPSHRPLTAPLAPPDVSERLAAWRARTAARLAPIQLDSPARFFDDPNHDLGEGVSGRLSVVDDTGV